MLAVYDPAYAGPDEHPATSPAPPLAPKKTRRPDEAQAATELAAQGIYVARNPLADEISYFSLDPESAKARIRERFGADVALSYLGASRRLLRPHPFGSWLAQGHSLHVFYALGRNGEQRAGCVTAELDDSIIVALSILDWSGAKTLVGGFIPSHETITLNEPLGERRVVDSFANCVRPHWKNVAEQLHMPRREPSSPV